MKFNYLADPQHASLQKKLMFGLTHALSRHLPKVSTRIGNKLLMTPHGKRSYTLTNKVDVSHRTIDTSHGSVHINFYGQANQCIVISHGWADNSSSFESIALNLVEQGYSVAVIDHIGHGRSEGKQAHLLLFVEAITNTLKSLEMDGFSVNALIGHSMGAFATLSLPDTLKEDKKIIIISMPVRFFDLMFEKVTEAGISTKMLINVLEHLTGQYNTHWQRLEEEAISSAKNNNVFFIHDETDRFAPLSHLTEDITPCQSRTYITQGLGHRRILNDNAVVQKIATYIE